MKPLTLLIGLALAAGLAHGAGYPFNDGWKFSRGAFDEAVSRAGFDTSGWEAVRVPHDWAIAGPFEASKHGYAGKLPWEGEGWYRKEFHVDSALAGRRVYIDFDGVMAFPRVYVNGRLVGEWDYGYNGFRVDATDAVNFGGANVIAVRATTENWGTRWYPGAGIYRKVTMVVKDPLHIAQWGVFAVAESGSVDGPPDRAVVRTTIENHTPEHRRISVVTRLVDPSGREVASDETPVAAGAGGRVECAQRLAVADPLLWDISHPHLYTVRVELRADGEVLDTMDTTFGFRTFKFTADDGFHLNGRRVQLHGVNLHHDLGPLGAAFNKRAAQRQLEIMQSMGVNALRTSHNPPAPEVLDLCDRMGIVVWDEVFDKWDHTAGRVGDQPPLPDFSRRQIRQTVLRDRNHPSVVVWSVANEVAYGEQDMSAERVAYMSGYVRELDTSRPVGMGCHIPQMVAEDHFKALELAGWNYDRRYADFREKYPDRPIVYSESASALSTRGFYELPLPESKTDYSETLQVDSYDLNAARWSDIPDKEFALMEQDRFVAGEFVWTGFDYIGEPTPFDAQARSSYFGIVDLCGIPKDRYYLYRSYWLPDETTVHILPHWNWPERVGQVVPVFVYTNGDSAELFLNGKSLGMRRKGELPPGKGSGSADTGYYDVTYRYRLRWNDVVYEPGELKVVAYKDGKPIGGQVMRTAGPPRQLRLTPDRTVLLDDGSDLSFILVEALDDSGVACPLADDLVQFAIDGPGDIAGVGNGNPLSLEPFQADYRRLFNGKAMLIVRTRQREAGTITVRASADGLQPAVAALAAGD